MKADIPESSLTVGMRTWKNLLEQSIPNAHAPVIGEVSPPPHFYI